MMYIKNKTVFSFFLLSQLFFLVACSSSSSRIEETYMSSQGWNKLSVAVHRGDIVKVKSLVLMGEDINHEGAYGDTPLKLAIEGRKTLIVHYLLKNGADASYLDAQFLKRYDKTGDIQRLINKYRGRAEFEKQSPAIIDQLNSADEGALVASQPRGTKTALVIGNSQYKFSPLRNPVNDAQDMTRILKLAGFDVTTVLDANQEQTDQAVNRFSDKLGGGIALFYYAGHAVQIDGHNYVIPVGEAIDSQEKVKYHGVDIDQVLSKMGAAKNELNIIVLDACRDNPLPKTSRSATRGLTRIEGPAGSLIAFATSPGRTAADGQGRNGVYTKYLLHYMKTPGLSIEGVLKGVSRSVKKATNNQQQPWVETSFDGEFSFFQ